jgi:hypothetical protein
MSLLEALRDSAVYLSLDGDRLQYSAPKGVITPEIIEHLRLHKTEIIQDLRGDIQHWIDRVNTAKTADEVLSIVSNEFRPLTWSDEDRSKVSKVYMRKIENFDM